MGGGPVSWPPDSDPSGRYGPAEVGGYVAAVVTGPEAVFTVAAAFDGKSIRLTGEVSDRARHDRLIDLLVAMRFFGMANEVRVPKASR